MAADHLQFLKENFILDYEEAVEEFHDELPLRPHFQEILEILNQITITSFTPIRMKRPLYGLKYVLAECVMLAEKRRGKSEKGMERRAQNKRSLPSVSVAHNFVKNRLLLIKTWRKLLIIRDQLLREKMYGLAHDAAAADQSSVKVHQPGDYQFFLERKIYGFNDHLQKIEAFLLDDGPVNSYGIKALGIVGIGGSGKTALMKKVFCSSRVQESFNPMIWLELPLSPIPLQSIVTAVCERFSSCGMNDHDNDLGVLLRKMHNCLLNTKYLIVLDGVWQASDWLLDLNSNSNLQVECNTFCTDHFLHGLPKESGGAIIITSRFQDVATKIVGEQNLYHLEPTLDGESCWSLILDSMPKTMYKDTSWSSILDSIHNIIDQDSICSSILDSMPFILHPTLVRMKDEMVDRCDGLPLAAKALAEIVCKKFEEERFQFTRSIRPEKIKLVCLRINKPHQIPIPEVLECIRACEGVIGACCPFDQNNYEEVVIIAQIFFEFEELVPALIRLSCEPQFASSIRKYNDAHWGGVIITVSILPYIMFNQGSDMNPLYRVALAIFRNPNATKEFYLGVDGVDHFDEVLQHLRVHPDVALAQSIYRGRGGIMMVETYYNPLEVIKDLRKYYEAEIIVSHIDVFYRKEMKYYKVEIMDSRNYIQYGEQKNRKLWRIPQMIPEKVNSEINNNPFFPSPSSLPSYIAKLFQDSIIAKKFRLRFDPHDTIPSSKILEEVRTSPGVNYANIDSCNINEIEGEGRCNLLELMRHLNKLVKAEIISLSR